MKLHTARVSLNRREVHGVAVHTGVELACETADLRADGRRLEFLAVDPMGSFPAPSAWTARLSGLPDLAKTAPPPV